MQERYQQYLRPKSYPLLLEGWLLLSRVAYRFGKDGCLSLHRTHRQRREFCHAVEYLHQPVLRDIHFRCKLHDGAGHLVERSLKALNAPGFRSQSVDAA